MGDDPRGARGLGRHQRSRSGRLGLRSVARRARRPPVRVPRGRSSRRLRRDLGGPGGARGRARPSHRRSRGSRSRDRTGPGAAAGGSGAGARVRRDLSPRRRVEHRRDEGLLGGGLRPDDAGGRVEVQRAPAACVRLDAPRGLGARARLPGSVREQRRSLLVDGGSGVGRAADRSQACCRSTHPDRLAPGVAVSRPPADAINASRSRRGTGARSRERLSVRAVLDRRTKGPSRLRGPSRSVSSGSRMHPPAQRHAPRSSPRGQRTSRR